MRTEIITLDEINECNNDPEHLLKEAARRAEHWSRQTDGNYEYSAPDGQVAQIMRMLIKAVVKGAAK